MASHRRRRIRSRGGRRAGFVACAVLAVGAGILTLAVMRADVTPARLAAGAPPPPAVPAAPAGHPATPAPAAAVTPAAGPFEGTWTGPLTDPDTATVEVRLTVAGPDGGVVLEVPSLRCTYRGPDPGRVTVAVADLRADGGGAGCTDTARIRLAAAPAEGAATERVRYELLASCDGSACTPRRASGLLTAWRPGR